MEKERFTMTLQQLVYLCKDTMQAKDFRIAIWKEDKSWQTKSFSLEEYNTCLKEKEITGFSQKLHPDVVFITSSINNYLRNSTQKNLHDFIKNLYNNQNNKAQILDTDFGSELEMTIDGLDFYHPEQGQSEENKDFDIYLAKWKVFQIALKQFYGINYYFVRNKDYYGLCITGITLMDENAHWLIKKKHLNLSDLKQDRIKEESKDEPTDKIKPLETPPTDTEEMTDEEANEEAKKIFKLYLEANQLNFSRTGVFENKVTDYSYIFCSDINSIGFTIFKKNREGNVTASNYHLSMNKSDRKRSDFQECIKCLEGLKNQGESAV